MWFSPPNIHMWVYVLELQQKQKKAKWQHGRGEVWYEGEMRKNWGKAVIGKWEKGQNRRGGREKEENTWSVLDQNVKNHIVFIFAKFHIMYVFVHSYTCALLMMLINFVKYSLKAGQMLCHRAIDYMIKIPVSGIRSPICFVGQTPKLNRLQRQHYYSYLRLPLIGWR